ncbi:hypothetical protein FEM48_Zijuj03G0110900 [Ziziphus jujuba var. spinosa]|uniref:mannosyl-glycoprotein endo-beta-N-acetylglucosaminidase n=1 Tax=Ziziphus jujuba var. spinosa TaxID=714518 RepID=A0A978VPY2_ZIZJJ|nr:hypothetical protein FEM48_Zijuj03G0110900 [Ziziphus jujuba var. spinosa]
MAQTTDSSSKSDLQSSAPEPTPFDPIKPSIPVSYPIKTLEDLESRSYFESFHYPFNKSSVPLQNGSSFLPSRPRLLVCHDMAGGYGDDKWVQGGSNADAYAIWHWYLIDVFVYFSHNLVALPPPCWTNTAHKHGVKVLGTFITEWKEGRAICDKLLLTKESSQMYAERLTELAVALGFDGWLLNIEVELDVVQIPNLKEFVSHLTKKMHSSLPGSLVIWYDSVTTDGNLSYQNQLTEKNKPFFDICDGIFVNYSWEVFIYLFIHFFPENYPSLSAAVAGDRKFDVYMGIDVFGRGTYGGGQWNTNVALDVLKKDDVSAAIFAPGWVYETKQPPTFQTAQNHWWSLVEKSWGITQNYPKVLPFYSNFDQGRGHHFSVDGVQVLDGPWCNISCQGFQPFVEFNNSPTPDAIQAVLDSKEASYSGGGNLVFKGNLKDNVDFRKRLFHGEVLIGHLPLYFTYSVKSENNSLLGLSLVFSSTVGETKSILLLPSEGKNQLSSESSEVIISQIENPQSSTGWTIFEHSMVMTGYKLTEIGAVCYRSKPHVGKSILECKTDDCNNTTGAPPEYHAVLGHISLRTTVGGLYFPPSSSWLVNGQDITWSRKTDGSKTLSVKIIWKLKDGNDSAYPHYNIFVEKKAEKRDGNQAELLEAVQEFLGVAQVEAFYIADLAIPPGISKIKFIIQICGVDGSNQKKEESPFLELEANQSA